MRVLVDMNLTPEWVGFLKGAGFEAVHWSEVGNVRADDTEIMLWARERQFVVFTHDMDFGTLLALTQSAGPSVIQVRTQDTTPEVIGSLLLSNLSRFETELDRGALIVIEEARSRVRVLPFPQSR
jgi:predicted nuclease of predicted toxin-antitoxin system